MSTAVYVLVGWVTLSLLVTAGLALVLRGRTMFNLVPVGERAEAAVPELQFAGRDSGPGYPQPAGGRRVGRPCG